MATPTLHGTVRPTSRSRRVDPAISSKSKVIDVEALAADKVREAERLVAPPQARIHETVFYTNKATEDSRGKLPSDSAESRILDHIHQNYNIPREFELDKVKFGPLSGLSYSERLISSYAHGALEPYNKARKAGAAETKPLAMCTDCGETGHWKWDCFAAFA